MNNPTAPTKTTTVVVTSFGYGHPLDPPTADITFDVRTSLRNPHHDPAMRELNGLDAVVREHVLTTVGAGDTVRALASAATHLLPVYDRPGGRPIQVAIGCVGGRHRSVALAEAVADLLRRTQVSAAVTHRDITKPVIQK
ncbi:RNase adapter RapZ [Streptosporangium sp. NPDC051022]|uniref:RapZ C-terminal domain-containing protein n=1 Tax=Streptosporangium sp. NPDC051022 TaxID=3155752 RepID=UPI00343C39C0